MGSGNACHHDFLPTASLDVLRLRADLLRRLRRFFEERGFLEVETPLLSADTVIDLHLDPIPVTVFSDPRQADIGQRMWLQTSPEFAMKRLLTAGAPSIYQVTRAFRGGESGGWHNPEFTIVEWYGVGHGLQQGVQLLSDLAEELLQQGPAERITYRHAFQRWVGIDPHEADGRQLAAAANRLGVAVPSSLTTEDRDGWLDLLLVECIEPQLGRHRPLILTEYPATQAALAQVRPGHPPVAERFELYFRGVELANGYLELLDAAELRRRNSATNELRVSAGKYPLPEPSRLLAAMDEGLPPCTGVALGFDRLVMLACGAKEIAEVVAFPIERA
ncbi:MAG: EF-P lysine aminoacylase GenX [Planctomycetes bacterium]|nr:EF-P lysine aminoacylase GenX [Planctomycetota bacterium]